MNREEIRYNLSRGVHRDIVKSDFLRKTAIMDILPYVPWEKYINDDTNTLSPRGVIMRRLLDKLLKPSVSSRAPTHVSREPRYLELDWKSGKADTAHVLRVLSLNDFTDVEAILEHLRDRSNVIVLKVKPSLVAEKMELKRALKRIQRTTSAIGGDIAGVREDIIIITPPSIKIARAGMRGGEQMQSAVVEVPVSNPMHEEPVDSYPSE